MYCGDQEPFLLGNQSSDTSDTDPSSPGALGPGVTDSLQSGEANGYGV